MRGSRKLIQKVILSLTASFLTAAFIFLNLALAASPAELQQSIEAKGKELQTINSQIQQTQSQINQVQGQGRTLKQALAELSYQVNQVNLGIRSSEINIEKLRLELQSLGYELSDVKKEVDVKEEAIAKILRQVQQKDNEGLLEVVLRNETLADSLIEIQGLRDIQSNLSVSVGELNIFQGELEENINTTNDKKGQVETENSKLKNRKGILADQQNEKDRLLKETKNQEGLYQERLKKLQVQQQGILDQISQLESQLKARFDPGVLPKKKAGLLILPVALVDDGGVGRISQNYGETAYSTRFYKGQPHNGMDISAPLGTPIYAASDGRVVRTDHNGTYYQYGRYILIDHGNNLSTLYAHLSGYAVSVGQSVTKGQLIGYVGNTGFVTGPHLHFGLYATPAGGWGTVNSKLEAGLVSVPPASGLVPIGVTLNPLNYL